MNSYIVKVLKTNYVTHNVKRFVVAKPAGYTYVPGQATDVSINKPGLENELRPFTFTSLKDAGHLEFIIKIYTGHDGVTQMLGNLNVGDELIVHEVFGTIAYKGPGVFIAGGAGITPFIAILRQLKEENKLAGNTLLFANRNDEDVILRHELHQLLGDAFISVLEKPLDPTARGGYIDRQLLEEYVKPGAYYYICGPDKFTEMMKEHLRGLGVPASQVVFEQ